VRSDIDNLNAAREGVKPEEVFMPTIALGGMGMNKCYRTENVC